MSRTDRLFALMQLLRRHRYAVSAHALAEKLAVSVRTVYRDIDTLRAQGADIRGEAGSGYVLQRDFLLPPLMFNENEIEALVFGMRWVATHADDTLAEEAKSVLVKVDAVLPAALSGKLRTQPLFPTGGNTYSAQEQHVLTLVRQALRGEYALHIGYTDTHDQTSHRTIWPLALGYFQEARLLAAWCALRQDFRHFRTDRIATVRVGARYPVPRALLLSQWQRTQDIDLHRFDF